MQWPRKFTHVCKVQTGLSIDIIRETRSQTKAIAKMFRPTETGDGKD